MKAFVMKCIDATLPEYEQYYDCSDRFYWIASEIPRPTSEQLRAIGMRCKYNEPVACTNGDIVWNGIESLPAELDNAVEKYRFVLEPDVHEHKGCAGCGNQTTPDKACLLDNPCCSCFEWRQPGAKRKNYTPKQPPQPEEPRFNVGEIAEWLRGFLLMCDGKEPTDHQRYNALLNYLLYEISDNQDGIKAFMERRK